MSNTIGRRLRDLAAILVLLALPLAGCDDKPVTYQGWIEANLIFVGPDEAGRVETLSVREGDKVEAGTPLFRLDSELHKADLNMTMATLANPSRRSSARRRWRAAGRARRRTTTPRRRGSARPRRASTPRRPGSRGAASRARSPAPCSRSISAPARW